MSEECSKKAFRRLCDDGVLTEDCANASDLSAVADAVYLVTKSQNELVRRLPLDRFRHAKPNEGHLLAAAMLRERAIACVLTLNFDLAFSTALTEVGARSDVATIAGPEAHNDLGTVNLVYLHRNVNASPDEWILRTETLESAWKAQWEQVVAMRFLSGPVTVFAGLGSPAHVLLDCVEKIRKALTIPAGVFHVDPGKQAESAFFAQLSLPAQAYVKLGWVDFMRALAARLVTEHRDDLLSACADLIDDSKLDDEDIPGLCDRITAGGLLLLGAIRATWTLDDTGYLPRSQVTTMWIADFLLCIGTIERSLGAVARFYENGIVEFWKDATLVTRITMAHGSGYRSWNSIEAQVVHAARYRRSKATPHHVIVAGAEGGRAGNPVPPLSIIPQEAEDDLLGSRVSCELVSTSEIRAAPGTVSNWGV